MSKFFTDNEDCKDEGIPLQSLPALSDELDMQDYQEHAIGDRWYDRRFRRR